jgi:hypothetical protein
MKKLQKEPPGVLERINDGIDAAIAAGIPKEAAIITLMGIELQYLENRIADLEDKVDELESKNQDFSDDDF